MADLHYFQRYSQKENVVTNNTLLLLSRIYHYSPAAYEDLLQSLFDDVALSVGPAFSQQEGGTDGESGRGSIPDGRISQPSFEVVIETKLRGNAGPSQLKRHLDRFENAETQVLLLVDATKPPAYLVGTVEEAIAERATGAGGQVLFRWTTFADLIEEARGQIPPYAAEMTDMVDDYEAFCTGLDLIPSAHYMMRAVQCGDTLEENIRHCVYYHPASRSYSDLGYLGLYKSRSVRAIGKPYKTVRARVREDGSVEVSGYENEPPTDEELQRISAAALDGHESRGYRLNQDRFYFLVDEFYRMDENGEGFHRNAEGGIRREKHFDLREELGVGGDGKLPPVEEIASRLALASWT